MSFNSLHIKKIHRETEKSVSIVFDVPKKLESTYSFKAGQYLTLKTTINQQEIVRSYSICSAPKSGDLKIAIKAIPNGVFSNHAVRNLKVGDILEVSSPTGRFTIDDSSSKNSLFGIAAGSGITPILSIIHDTLESNPSSKFILLYGNKSKSQTMFMDEINQLEQSYTNRFFCHKIFSQENNSDCEFGRIDSSFINYCIKKHQEIKIDKFLICGPEQMTIESTGFLKSLGHDESNILFELFYSISNQEIEQDLEMEEITARITCDFEDFEIIVPKNMTILDAALDNNIDVPYSCQGGVCSSCVGKITDGSAKMSINNVLSDNEVSDGLTLACQAIPTSKNISIDFDDV